MSARNNILRRLRQAGMKGSAPDLPRWQDASVFADFPQTESPDLVRHFAHRFEALQGEFYQAGSAAEARARLLQLVEKENGPVLVQPHEWLRRILNPLAANSERFHYMDAYSQDSREMEKAAAGITTVDFLVARTGSLFLRSHTAFGRRLSVLPPLHIVLARPQQIVASLEQGFSKLKKENQPWSYGVLITGPSRTADIEKILVLGAHGPKRLAVILVAE